VFNKIDLTGESPRIELDDQGRVRGCFSPPEPAPGSSCCSSDRESFPPRTDRAELLLPPHAGRLRAALYEHLHVVSEQVGEDGRWRLTIELSDADLAWLQHQADFDAAMLLPEPHASLPALVPNH